MKIYKRYAKNQGALCRCRRKKRLEKLLLLSDSMIGQIDETVEYHSFEQLKKDSTTRQIMAPAEQLKVAYFVYEKMFHGIGERAVASDCTFSLYVDDMAFISDRLSDRMVLWCVGNIFSERKAVKSKLLETSSRLNSWKRRG
jgi:hypothetical protein